MNIIDKLKKINEYSFFTYYSPNNFIRRIAYKAVTKNARPTEPSFASWNLVNECNLNCFFCSADANKKKHKELDYESCMKIVDYLIQNKVSYIQLLGGEPTLHSRYLDIIKKLAYSNLFVELVTNGSGIDYDGAEQLSKMPKEFLRIKVSLDSSDKIINDKQRGKNSFQYATNAISLLSDRGIVNLRVQMVVTKFNKDNIFEMYKYLHKYNLNSFGITMLLPTGRGKEFEPPEIDHNILDQILAMIDYYDDKKKIKLEKFHFGYIQNIMKEESICYGEIDEKTSNLIFKIKCSTGIIKMNIDSNGDVYPCDYLRFPEFKMGNILTDTHDKIWNNKKFLELVNLNRNEKKECSSCKHKKCNTGCTGLAYEKYRDIRRKDPNCKIVT